MRGKPYPLWYRRLVLAIAALLDARVQAMRYHVWVHTPTRPRRMTATRVLQQRDAYRPQTTQVDP